MVYLLCATIKDMGMRLNMLNNNCLICLKLDCSKNGSSMEDKIEKIHRIKKILGLYNYE